MANVKNLVNPFQGTVDGFKDAVQTAKEVHNVGDFFKLARLGDPAVTDAAHAARSVSEGASGFRARALVGSHAWTGSQVGAVGLGYANLEKPESGLLPGEKYLPEPNLFKEGPFGNIKGWADTGSG